MKIIKGALFVFAGLFIFLTLISLLIPSKVVTSRALAVQGDSVKIFNVISNLKQWKKWHPVFIEDSNSIIITGNGNEVNNFAEWQTKGKKNTLNIEKVAYPSVTMVLKREGETPTENILTLRPVQEQGNLQVQWTAIATLKWYPWEKFSGIFIEKMAGSGYEYALGALKKYVETTP